MKRFVHRHRALSKAAAHILMVLPAAGLLMGPKASHAQTNVPYTFQNVRIGAEGQITAMASHPLNGNLVYMRGDGGTYRFDSASGKWAAISDNLPPVSDGVTAAGASIPESLGLDPNSQNIIYAGIGGGVCRSTDQGNSWSAVHTILNSGGQPIHQDWNGTGKNENNRIAVDPNNSVVVYYGSNQDGLFKSTDSGTTWSKITAFPTDAGPGDVVAFDKGGGTTTVGGQTVSGVIYVGVSAGTSTDNGVWKSSNGGASWTHLTGFAMDVEQAMITTNGTLYVVGAGTGGVGKVTRGATTITNITPSTASSYDAIAVDLTDATGNTAMVCDNQYCNSSGCQHVWRTTNGGTAWTNIIGTGSNGVTWSDETGPPSRDIQACCINATNGKIGWIGDSFAPWQAPDMTVASPLWTCIYNGYDGMTGMWPFCPPSGAPLLTGCMDPSAYRSTSVTTFPTEVFPVGGRVQQIGWCESDPNYVALASYGGYYGYTGNSGYSTSTNNMLTTTNVTSGNMGGSIVVTSTKQANGKPIIFWMPMVGTGSNPPLRSTDWGATWQTVTGLPSNIQCPYWQSEEFVSPDKVNGSKVYVSNIFDGTFWRSTDGAASFQQVSSLPLTNALGFHVEAQHGIEGKIWINPNDGVLRYSTDSGSTWTSVANLTNVLFYALGKPASGFTTPALYVYGNEAGNFGIWRSDNATSLTGNLSGATWVRIWNPATDTKLPYRANSLGADYQTYGRIYFTVAGRAVSYGDPSSGGPPPAPGGLTATAGNTQVSLAWNASSGATSYSVYRGTTAGGESGTAIATGVATTSYTNTGLTNGTTYYYTVKAVNASGTSGASNEASATPSVGGSATNIFGTVTPTTPDGGPDSSVEVGCKFKSDVAGTITGVRFYKASTNTGTHTGTLWSIGGTNLGTVTFSGETASGWQQANFTSGIAITANTDYVISYHCAGGHYSADQHYFQTAGHDNNPLHALKDGTDGVNGVFTYGASTVFPSTGFNQTNYYVDVVFSAAGSPPPVPTGLVATPGNAQVALTWNASTGATAYDVKRSTVSGSGYVTVSSPSTTSYTNTGLTNGTTYYFVVDAKNANGTSANSAQVSATPTASGESPWSGTACGGSAWAVPGTIQAENFDCGGEGVAYHDTDSTNNGGQYRTTDGVDIETTADTGGGFDIGWINAGEWEKFTCNVATTKTYSIGFRVSSPNASTCHLEDTNGTNLTGVVNIPNSGGGQNWSTVTVNNVSLTAGQHTFKLVEDGGGQNINWISFQ